MECWLGVAMGPKIAKRLKVARSTAYRSPPPAAHEVICYSLRDRPAGATQQAQSASIHKEMAMNARFLQAL